VRLLLEPTSNKPMPLGGGRASTPAGCHSLFQPFGPREVQPKCSALVPGHLGDSLLPRLVSRGRHTAAVRGTEQPPPPPT